MADDYTEQIRIKASNNEVLFKTPYLQRIACAAAPIFLYLMFCTFGMYFLRSQDVTMFYKVLSMVMLISWGWVTHFTVRRICELELDDMRRSKDG